MHAPSAEAATVFNTANTVITMYTIRLTMATRETSQRGCRHSSQLIPFVMDRNSVNMACGTLDQNLISSGSHF